jgi:pyruvate dehydrogenase E1 component alpha subunit
MEHVGPGEDFAAGYREQKLIDEWKSKDPLIQEKDLIAELTPEIQKEINQAFEFAMRSPFPSEKEILTDVC